MTSLPMIQINEPVSGFAGQASGQREFADEERDLQHVLLIGGAMQVWVPNLEPRHVSAVPVRG